MSSRARRVVNALMKAVRVAMSTFEGMCGVSLMDFFMFLILALLVMAASVQQTQGFNLNEHCKMQHDVAVDAL